MVTLTVNLKQQALCQDVQVHNLPKDVIDVLFSFKHFLAPHKQLEYSLVLAFSCIILFDLGELVSQQELSHRELQRQQSLIVD